MTTPPTKGVAQPRLGHTEGQEEKIALMRRIIGHETQAQESAAILLLLGNELARHYETGDSLADQSFGEFIACGIIGLATETARKLHQSTQAPLP